jgi:hypothetical protein
MRLTVTVYPADRNQFIVNGGNIPDPRPGDRGPFGSDKGNHLAVDTQVMVLDRLRQL